MSCKRIIIAALLAAPASAARVDDEHNAAPKKKAMYAGDGAGDEAFISQSISADNTMNINMQQQLSDSALKAGRVAGESDGDKQAVDAKITQLQATGMEQIQKLQESTAGRIFTMQRKAQHETRTGVEKEESESLQKTKEVKDKAQLQMKTMLDGAMSEILQAKERSQFEVRTAEDKSKAEIEAIASKGEATIEDAKTVADLQKTQMTKQGKQSVFEIEKEQGITIGKVREEATATTKMKTEEIHSMSEKSIAKCDGEAEAKAKEVQHDGERKVQALTDELTSHRMEVKRKIFVSDKESRDRVHNVEKETALDLADLQARTVKTVKQIQEEAQVNIDLKIKNVKVSTAAEMHNLDALAESTMTHYQEQGMMTGQQTQQEAKERLALIESRVSMSVSAFDSAQKLNGDSLKQSNAQAVAEFQSHKAKMEEQARTKEQELLQAAKTAETNTIETQAQGNEHVKKLEEASASRIGQIKSTTEAKEKQLEDNANTMSQDEEAMIKTEARVKGEEMKTLEHMRETTDKKIEEADHKASQEMKRLSNLADRKIADTQMSVTKEMKMADCNMMHTMIQSQDETKTRIEHLKKASDAESKTAAAFQAQANTELAHIKGELRSHVDKVKHDAEVVVHQAQVQSEQMVQAEKARAAAAGLQKPAAAAEPVSAWR